MGKLHNYLLLHCGVRNWDAMTHPNEIGRYFLSYCPARYLEEISYFLVGVLGRPLIFRLALLQCCSICNIKISFPFAIFDSSEHFDFSLA